MPVPVPAGLKLGIVEPKDAIAAFQQRKLLEPSFRWQDVFQEEHSRAFAIAGVQRLDILQLFQEAIDKAVSDGTDLAAFRKDVRGQLVAKGWWGDIEIEDPHTGEQRVTTFDDRRLNLIFEVNTRQAHAAGRWARIERTKDRFPLVMYRTMQDERVRASHRPWDGVVLPVDDDWWNTHFPPCGWRCRCTAFATNEKDLARRATRGEVIKREAPPTQWITYVNPRTGEAVPVPRGVDPGFAYNPGKQRDAEFFEAAMRKALTSSPMAAAVAVAQATLDHPALLAQTTAVFTGWVNQVLGRAASVGEVRYIGAIDPAALRALQAVDLEPANAVIAVRDRDVLHALRDAKVDALPVDTYARLPELLKRARALLAEADGPRPSLLYVVDLVRPDGAVAKLVLQLDAEVRLTVEGKRASVPLNIVRTAKVMDPNALLDRTRYRVIWGSVE